MKAVETSAKIAKPEGPGSLDERALVSQVITILKQQQQQQKESPKCQRVLLFYFLTP